MPEGKYNMSFELNLPRRIIFGKGSIRSIGCEAKKLGRKVLLVTGKRALAAVGVLDQFKEYLETAGLEVVLYNKVFPEPDLSTVDEGMALACQAGCDLIIGLGGGSSLDVAKTVAGLAKNGGKTVEYQEGREIRPELTLPFMAIPTTAGTGAEATYNAVITNPDQKVKKSIRSPALMAVLAVVDPELTMTASPEVTASAGMDALSHLVEGYCSLKANPVTDSLALSGIGLVGRSLRKAYNDGGDIEAREDMSLAALLGGIVLANAGLGAAHGLAASLGPVAQAPHGLVCAVLLPYVMEFNLEAVPQKLSMIAAALTGMPDQGPEAAAREVKNLLSDLSISGHLRDLGVAPSDISKIVKGVSSSAKYNPRPASPEDLTGLLEKAM
ncbi:MAG: iron-containing alcohol dehydrogenase [bacterium]